MKEIERKMKERQTEIHEERQTEKQRNRDTEAQRHREADRQKVFPIQTHSLFTQN